MGRGAVRRASVVGTVVALLAAGQLSPAAPTSAAAGADRVGPQRAVSPSKSSGSDFDRDGYADLAVSGASSPIGDEGTYPYPGVVNVLYGSPSGLTRTGSQRWTAADFTRGDGSEAFGQALATGDFDGDGFSDLAIGIAENSADRSGVSNAGRVRIVFGSPAGLSRARSQQWSQNSPGILGGSEAEDGFGSSLVAADFGRGPQDDLAVGVAGENGSRGAVNLIYGSSTGLTATGDQFWTQASPGVPGKRATRDLFGASLAAGTFAGNKHADLAIGVPGDRVGRVKEAGSVNVLYGSAAGLRSKDAERWSQQTAGVKGRSEAEDRFGTTLAAGHFAGRSAADLAVGVTGENAWHGAVNVIYGSPGGLTAKGDQIWTAKTAGLGGRSRLDGLGLDMTTGNFGHDAGGRRFSDLVLRAEESRTGLGIVEVIYGSSKGLATPHSRALDLDSPGIEGEASLGTDFGSALAAGNFGIDVGGHAHDDLVVADPWYGAGGAFSVICGSPSGLTAERNKLWTGDDLGQPGLEYLGQALAAG